MQCTPPRVKWLASIFAYHPCNHVNLPKTDKLVAHFWPIADDVAAVTGA